MTSSQHLIAALANRATVRNHHGCPAAAIEKLNEAIIRPMAQRRGSISSRRGWLLKRGGLFKTTFQRRYFILRGNELQRYQNDRVAAEGPTKAKAIIKMEGVADVRPAENDNGKLPENAIDIYFIDGKILTLCAESNSDMLAWIKDFSVFVFVQQKIEKRKRTARDAAPCSKL